MYTTIQRHIQSQKNWLQLDSGIEICATHYQSPMWDAPRRLIIVRQEIKERPKATGKMLRLFEDDDVVSGYRHSCYITNLKLPAVEVWRLYRGRANCENQIKELKYDYAVDKMNQNSFDATETTMNFIMIAYNLMSLFKQVVIPAKAKPMLKTIRYTTLNIGSYIVKTGRDKVLKMSLQMKRRKWITQLWSNIEILSSHLLSLILSSNELFGLITFFGEIIIISFASKSSYSLINLSNCRFIFACIFYIAYLHTNCSFHFYRLSNRTTPSCLLFYKNE
jgi:hypothetical protein